MTLATTALLTILAAQAADRGDLVITEVMVAPKGTGNSNCEWIELATTGGDVALDGCMLIEIDPADSSNIETTDLTGITIPSSATSTSPAILARDTESCRPKKSDEIECVAYDAKGGCVAPVTGVYTSLGINNGDDRTLCVACGSAFTACDDSAGDTIVDEFTFNWDGDFGGECDTDTYTGGCTANLCGDVDADVNDDIDAWSVPDAEGADEVYNVNGSPVLATPGTESACPVVLPGCGEGDAVITEIMTTPKSDPQSNVSHEYFEIKGTGTECDLAECWLVQLEADGSIVDVDYTDKGVLDGGKYTQIDVSLGVTSGDYLVMSHGYTPVAVSDPSGEEIPADYEYDYSGFWMSPKEGRELAIYCGGSGEGSEGDSLETLFGELVDKAPMYFEHLDAWCPDKGCAMNVPPDSETAEANDDADNWCIPELTQVHDDEEATFIGTPDAVGSCQAYDWPQPGELIFTEFMPDPEGTPDWFEMHNLAGREIELSWCILSRYRYESSDTGGEEVKTLKESQAFVGSDGNSYPVAADAWQVFSQKACLFDSADDTGGFDTGEATDDDDVPEICETGEIVYSKGSMTTSYQEYMALECGGQLIDEASVDATRQGLRDGHSSMFDFDSASSEPDSVNDNLEYWCEAAFSLECFQVSDEKCNYGTPGEANDCRADNIVVDGRPGCMCASTGGRVGALAAALAAIALGLVRRRRG